MDSPISSSFMQNQTNSKVKTHRIQFDDKENKSTFINNSNTHQINHEDIHHIKTGAQIRNKIQNKHVPKNNHRIFTNNFNKTHNSFSSSNFGSNNTNSHLPQNIRQKIVNRQHALVFNETDQSKQTDNTKIRSNSKSVKFSLNQSSNSVSSLTGSLSKKPKGSSILKNKIKTSRSNLNLEKQSLASSCCSHIKGLDQSVQNLNGNSIIREKYQKLVKQLQSQKSKFIDPIYPPNRSSLFLRNSQLNGLIEKIEKDGCSLEWMRIGDLFKKYSLSVWKNNDNKKGRITKGAISSSHKDNDYLPSVFNSIKQKPKLLEKMFQSQEISSTGTYYIKIHQTQTNTWKYVIIDDFIPVIINKNLAEKKYQPQNVKPAFLNVHPMQGVIQIWPYLLQKALAKYYSTYDALFHGNTLDFLEQLTGCFVQKLTLFQNQKDEQKVLPQLKKILSNPFCSVFIQDKKGLLHPLKNKKSQDQSFSGFLDLDNPQNLFTIQNRQMDFKHLYVPQAQIFQRYINIYYIELHQYSNTVNCLIKQQNLLSKERLQNNNNSRQYILRHFTLLESSQTLISAIQKQKRFYRNNKKYEYSYMRMLIVMKQCSGYRWIGGKYDKVKSLTFRATLEAGEYFIILIPQWYLQPFDMNLLICSNIPTQIQRKPYNQFSKIIEEGCMDLCQRLGKLKQINKNICSYNYIESQLGLIIENINNEKHEGEIKILRSIQGLDGFNIQPLNQEFFKNKNSKVLDIRINKLQSFTVVLRTKGGVDKNFLKMFDFGC